jgi:hypothetical protein
VEKMGQFPQNYITVNGLRGIKLACWRALCGKFKNIFIGKMGPFPLNYVTASQEKPIEWLTYLSNNVASYLITFNPIDFFTNASGHPACWVGQFGHFG